MLAQAVLASYDRCRTPTGKRVPTVTSISPCPYETYIRYQRLDPEEVGPEDALRMKDGHWQERQVLEDLSHAGFPMRYTGDSQLTVHVGKVPIPGRPDGLITVRGREDILSIKAMNLSRFTKFRRIGLEAEPRIRCQEQLYLSSEELKGFSGTWIYAKHKDSCRPYDLFEEKDLGYSRLVTEAAEGIILGGEEVRRPETPTDLCAGCRHRIFCWKDDLVDTSGASIRTMPEAIRMWLEGQFHLDIGKQLNEDSRVVFREALGEENTLFCEDQDVILKIQKILRKTSAISMSSFVERYGGAALAEVLEEKVSEQIRISRR